ncbi:ATP-binding cassette domain-containing protein [Oscillatoria sp. FACHB-1407]|uniref:ABC transporter ATP-binding protein n=1 Tax=Oscillatoria sp. FACHB-1407 TaxID=2692847 RepID=UPI001688F00D|nr:ATP-binding cassette domain-containing protein [Oscillatoria sp. FACHB-1407]MBD2465885.1 ATP-binding cassette domain-containing protein [Oscillatoria sp. FACHB-1407]
MQNRSPIAQPSMVEQLRLEHVSFQGSVGSQTILNDISFRVMRGDRLVVIGPSGAGKTSLLRLLNRLSDTSQGTIYLENCDIRQVPVLQLRQQIILVLQESKLLGMTVREALTYPLQLRGIAPSVSKQRLDFWLEELHIPVEWLDRTEVQLSVGQRQLVAIARALMTEPKVLLLDEPTSALDAGRGEYLMQVLTRLAQRGTAILMVNHQLDLAKQFGDRVLYLQQGALLQDASASQIDWQELKERLVQAEEQEAQEWA